MPAGAGNEKGKPAGEKGPEQTVALLTALTLGLVCLCLCWFLFFNIVLKYYSPHGVFGAPEILHPWLVSLLPHPGPLSRADTAQRGQDVPRRHSSFWGAAAPQGRSAFLPFLQVGTEVQRGEASSPRSHSTRAKSQDCRNPGTRQTPECPVF